MNTSSLSRNLSEFALELRKLAYTMPGGCEDPLIRLSERMADAAEKDEGVAAVGSSQFKAAAGT